MSRVLRLGKILQVVGRYRLDEFIDQERLPGAVRLLLLCTRMDGWRLFLVSDVNRSDSREAKVDYQAARLVLPAVALAGLILATLWTLATVTLS